MNRTERSSHTKTRGAIVVGAAVWLASAVVASPSFASTAGSKTASSPTVQVSYNKRLAALVPASLREKKVLVAAANATYPPDEYISAANKIVGFDPDLASAVGTILGLRFRFVNTAFANIIPGLQDGRYDLGWSSATATPARQQVVNFVTEFRAGIGFMVAASSTLHVTSLADLCGLTVAVEQGSLEDTTAEAQSSACVSEGKQSIQLQTYEDESQNVLAITTARAQVTLGGSQILPYLVSQSHGRLKVVGSQYAEGWDGIELPKTTPIGFAKALQGALDLMIHDGAYKAIMSKWGEQANMIVAAKILPAPQG